MKLEVAKLFNTRVTVDNQETEMQDFSPSGSKHFTVSLEQRPSLNFFNDFRTIKTLEIEFQSPPRGNKAEQIQAIQNYITSRLEPDFLAGPATRFNKLSIAAALLTIFQNPPEEINLTELNNAAIEAQHVIADSKYFAGGDLGKLIRKLDSALNDAYVIAINTDTEEMMKKYTNVA